MKKLIIIITLFAFVLVGCASQPIKYRIENIDRPTYQDQQKYREVKEMCSSETGFSGGTFLFGPLIIILPIWIILMAVESGKRTDFNTCMENNGYKCIENCP